MTFRMKLVPLTSSLLRDIGHQGRPWLLLGKGPSYSCFSDAMADQFNVLALNHAMRGKRVLVGHAIDIEVFDHMREEDLEQVKFLCVPWVPHVRKRRLLSGGKAFFGPGERNLLEYCSDHPVLQRYSREGRLISYNLQTVDATRMNPELSNVKAGSFSASVALELLAQFGAREIRTLGIDGGSSYADSFSDIEQRTKLQTGQTSFDIQFREMASTIQKYDLLAGPLHMQIPVSVFVGCMPEQELAYQVLKYSIQRNSSVSVAVERLHEAVASKGISVREPLDPANRGRTPFSFQRFAIPAVCEYKGRAIYLDSDMLVLGDMRQLAEFPLEGMQMASAASPPGSGRPAQFSVMVIDCAELDWDVNALVEQLDRGTISYEDLMYRMKSVQRWAPKLPYTWNSFELHEEGRTQLIHFTDMDTQPWLNPWHPLGPLWAGYLIEAVQRGAIPLSLVEQEVRERNVRPSILEQLRRHQPDPRRLPLSVLRADLVDFFPVHRRAGSKLSRINHELYRIQLMARHFIQTGIIPPIRRLRRVASRLLNRVPS